MPTGNIPNYQGALSSIEFLEDGWNLFVKVYNDTGSTATNGDVFYLNYEKDADSLDPSARATLTPGGAAVFPSSSSVYQHVVVINNAPKGTTSIADQEWGWAQLRGYCPDVNYTTTASAAIDRYMQPDDGDDGAKDDGTAKTVYSFAISTSALFNTSHVEAFLFGERCLCV